MLVFVLMSKQRVLDVLRASGSVEQLCAALEAVAVLAFYGRCDADTGD